MAGEVTIMAICSLSPIHISQKIDGIVDISLSAYKQGGYIDDGTEIVSRNIKYPIAFSKAILSINFTMICPVGGQSYGYAARITSISGLTSFAAYSNYPKAFWLAIGI